MALAHDAMNRGAAVTLVAAHIEVPAPSGVEVVKVSTAVEMHAAMTEMSSDFDIVIMAAAVADYRPAQAGDKKLKKSALGETPSISLIQNPDILAELGAEKHSYKLIGFAAETESDLSILADLATAKLSSKKCDAIVVNTVGKDSGFGNTETTVHVVVPGGRIIESASGSKASVAHAILSAIS